jgi:hypothetical protein
VRGDVPEVTGIACPDCCGVLAVRIEGRDKELSFVCRIGHTDDVTELLSAKEEALEDRLWSAVTGFEELAVTEALREIARTKRPIDLAPSEPAPPIARPPDERAVES